MTTLVIGAGMAGLTAARDLVKVGEQVTVLEARERAGGRVYTSQSFASHPVEFGAELIHGSEAPTWLLVRQLGLPTFHWRKTDDSLVRLADGSLRTMADARAQFPDFDMTRSWALPDVPVLEGDETLESYLTRVGFTKDQLTYTRRSWGNAAGDDLSRLSAAVSLVEMNDDTAGTGDYRILDGYASLIDALSDGLDVRFNTIVDTIQWEQSPVVVTTRSGETFSADRVLVTLPLGVLKAGHVRFVPPLPAEKQAAIDALVMGPALKLVYRFAEPVLPPGIGALYSATNPPMWWSPSVGRESMDDSTVITAFITGDWARELHTLGEEGALEQGFQTLQRELGRELPRPQDSVMVNWIDDPFALGGYSVAPPGAAEAREILAQTVEGRLFWAGEATAPNAWSSTVHGAYESGQRAAAEILVMLAR